MEFFSILTVATLLAKCGLVLIATVIGGYALHRVVREFRATSADDLAAADADADRLDGWRARANMQHAWVLQGDPRGVFGDESASGPM